VAGRTIPAAATENPGNYITSALWNTQITNGVYSFVFNPPYFKGSATTTQSISSGTSFSAITLTGSITDTEGGWSTSAPTVYTVQTPGRYLILTNIFLPSASSTDTSGRGCGIWIGGSPARVTESANAPNIGWQGQCSITQYITAGTTVGMYAMQNSGSTQSTVVSQTQQQPMLELIWMGAH
jgi:hypothetical protein